MTPTGLVVLGKDYRVAERSQRVATSQKYRIVFAETITHQQVAQGHPMGRAITGVRLRAEPVRSPSDDPTTGIDVPTPGGQVGFTLYGADYSKLAVGGTFTLTVTPG
jgi:hypothetical protein